MPCSNTQCTEKWSISCLPLAGNGPETFMLPTQSKQESFLPAGQCWGIGSRWCPFLLVHLVFPLHPSPQYKETLAGQEEPAYSMAADSPVKQRDYTHYTKYLYSQCSVTGILVWSTKSVDNGWANSSLQMDPRRWYEQYCPPNQQPGNENAVHQVAHLPNSCTPHLQTSPSFRCIH